MVLVWRVPYPGTAAAAAVAEPRTQNHWEVSRQRSRAIQERVTQEQVSWHQRRTPVPGVPKSRCAATHPRQALELPAPAIESAPGPSSRGKPGDRDPDSGLRTLPRCMALDPREISAAFPQLALSHHTFASLFPAADPLPKVSCCAALA